MATTCACCVRRGRSDGVCRGGEMLTKHTPPPLSPKDGVFCQRISGAMRGRADFGGLGFIDHPMISHASAAADLLHAGLQFFDGELHGQELLDEGDVCAGVVGEGEGVKKAAAREGHWQEELIREMSAHGRG